MSTRSSPADDLGSRSCRASSVDRKVTGLHSITLSARASSESRHVEAEGLRRLEIYEQLKFSWKLNWQVGRLGPLEDQIDI